MLTKAERDADAAILAEATPGPWEGSDANDCIYGRPDPDPRSEGECDLVGCSAEPADRRAIVRAVNRLPAYIEAAAEMERRIDALKARLDEHWARSVGLRERAMVAGADIEAAKASALRDALRLLRGSK